MTRSPATQTQGSPSKNNREAITLHDEMCKARSPEAHSIDQIHPHNSRSRLHTLEPLKVAHIARASFQFMPKPLRVLRRLSSLRIAAPKAIQDVPRSRWGRVRSSASPSLAATRLR